MDEQQVFTCEYCGKDDFETARQLQGHKMTCKPKYERERQEREETTARKKRIPLGIPRLSTQAPEKDGCVYRKFNDNWRHDPTRIQRAKEAGYEIVGENDVTGRTVGTNDDGTEIKGVLMRIPEELYDEDQAEKIRRTEEAEKQIYEGTHTMQAGEKRYNPSGGTKIITKNTP